eukprot:362342-Chlamydomonas_euryale.AAC.15
MPALTARHPTRRDEGPIGRHAVTGGGSKSGILALRASASFASTNRFTSSGRVNVRFGYRQVLYVRVGADRVAHVGGAGHANCMEKPLVPPHAPHAPGDPKSPPLPLPPAPCSAPHDAAARSLQPLPHPDPLLLPPLSPMPSAMMPLMHAPPRLSQRRASSPHRATPRDAHSRASIAPEETAAMSTGSSQAVSDGAVRVPAATQCRRACCCCGCGPC